MHDGVKTFYATGSREADSRWGQEGDGEPFFVIREQPLCFEAALPGIRFDLIQSVLVGALGMDGLTGGEAKRLFQLVYQNSPIGFRHQVHLDSPPPCHYKKPDDKSSREGTLLLAPG